MSVFLHFLLLMIQLLQGDCMNEGMETELKNKLKEMIILKIKPNFAALGIEAAKKINSVYFISCNDLITNLSNEFKENRLESKIKFYCKYKLLIIDEIGYLPITKDEANMFFQLIAKRYENKPTIITTNQLFSKQGEAFGDATIASAIIDRLVRHSVIINIKGKSYRIKDLVKENFDNKKNS